MSDISSEQSCLIRSDSLAISTTNLITRILTNNVDAKNEDPNPVTETEMKCSICLEEMDEEEGNLFTIPKCSHTYHKDCIARWKRQSQKCPICRGVLPEEIGPTLSRLQNLPEEQVFPDMTWCAILGNVIFGVLGIVYPLLLVVLIAVLECAFLGIFIFLTFFIANYLIFAEEDEPICSSLTVVIILCMIFPIIICGLVAAFFAQIFYMFYRMLIFYGKVFMCKIRWSAAFSFIIKRTITVTIYCFDMLG